MGGEMDCPHVQVSFNNLKGFDRLQLYTWIFFQELLKASDVEGSVDLSQFLKLWQQFKASVSEDGDTEEDIQSAFKDYDVDGDGYITKDEMMRVCLAN